MTNNKTLIVLFLAAFACADLYAMKLLSDNRALRAYEEDAASNIIAYTSGIGQTLNQYLKDSKLGTSEAVLTKLDFSPPRAAPCGKESEYKVFKCGKTLWDGTPRPYYPDPFSFSGLVKNSKYYFTLGNKIEGQGTEATDLVMVVAGPSDNICRVMNKLVKANTNGDIPKLSTPINLAANGETLIKEGVRTLPAHDRACYEGIDGKYYYVTTLIVR